VIRGICQYTLYHRPDTESARLILGTLSKVNAVLDVCDLVGMFSYFCSTQGSKRDRLLKIKNDEEELEIVKKAQPLDREGMTMFQYHLAKGSFLKAAMRVAALSTLTTGSTLLCERLKLIHLGELIGASASDVFLSMTLGGAVTIHATVCLDTAIYLYEAHNGDLTKDKAKGWYRLAYRSSALALSLITFYGGASVLVTAPILVVSGIFGVKSNLQNMEYRERKREQDEVLFEELVAKEVVS
jgi:hypothetical protein